MDGDTTSSFQIFVIIGADSLAANFRHLGGTNLDRLYGLLSVRSRWCAGHEILWPRDRCLLRRKLK